MNPKAREEEESLSGFPSRWLPFLTVNRQAECRGHGHFWPRPHGLAALAGFPGTRHLNNSNERAAPSALGNFAGQERAVRFLYSICAGLLALFIHYLAPGAPSSDFLFISCSTLREEGFGSSTQPSLSLLPLDPP